MKTLEELKTAIQKHLLELEKLEQNPYALNEKYVLREKAIGRLCYEAEETLSAGDDAIPNFVYRYIAEKPRS